MNVGVFFGKSIEPPCCAGNLEFSNNNVLSEDSSELISIFLTRTNS